MNGVQQAKQRAEFEKVLLSYVEMCYSVAFALTRNPRRAQELAKYALTRAWHMRDNADGKVNTKRELLQALRERFLQHYCQSPCSLMNAAVSGEDAAGQAVERDVEEVSLDVPTVGQTS